ncbi:hypothetical protein HYW83_03650, partial [Candidatus Peregrinibacteria bacterium]|nr:hypothetical protein [Candidatus Peregrinibacteria bacterium]
MFSKLTKLFIVIGFVAVLSSCSFFSKKEDVPQAPPEEIQLERKTGVVNTAEALNILTAPSKFALVIENAAPVFIDSASVNFRKYFRRRVEIEGKWNDEKTVFLVENVTSLTQDANSKTLYESPLLGIKFQYPSLWIVKEQQNVLGAVKIIITPYEVDDDELESVDFINIERSENNRRLSPREWLGLDEQYRSSQNGTSTISTPIYQQSRIGTLQLDSVKSTLGNGEEIKFYVARDTYIYSFIHKTLGDSDKDQYRNAFYDIVMSFEFIPLIEAPAPLAVSKPASAPAAAAPPVPSASLSDLAAEQAEERKKQEEVQQKTDSLAESRQSFIDYIKSHIAELAPEPASVGGTWFVQSVEFAYPEGEPENFTAIYVVYEDGHDLRKILLTVADKNTPSSVTRVAYFKPGDSTDWKLAEGTDSAKGTERTKINVISGGAAETSIKKGMTLLEARSFKIKIQYPSSWYWAYRNTGYSFSNKPVSGENVLIHLTKNPEILPENMAPIGELGGKPATEGEMAEALSVCVQGT